MLAFPDFPSHVRLMLLTAGSPRGVRETEQIRALAAGEGVGQTLDWDGFLAVTEHHRVSSLVFDVLERMQPEGVPEFVRAELQRRARENAFEAVRAAGEVGRMTARFAEAGIELSVMKGVPLSQILFGNPGSRHVGDIDLLTDLQRLPEQIALLGELGYERINPKSRLTPLRLASYVHFWKDFTFQNMKSGFELDLHWRLFNNRFHAANRILPNAQYTRLTAFGVSMRVFSPHEQFLYIAAHGISDAWTYLKSLADVAGFLRLFTQAELDSALERAETLGLLAQISAAVHLANDWMGTDARSPRLLGADEATARRIRQRTTRLLLRQDFKPQRNFPSPVQWLGLELELVPGMRSLLEIARRFVWRPRVWATVDLPDGLFWMYPVLGLLMLPRHHSVED
jgi:hypothetical protein